jgi:hypothetical protein
LDEKVILDSAEILDKSVMEEKDLEIINKLNSRAINVDVNIQEALQKIYGKKKVNDTMSDIERVGMPTGYELDYVIGDNIKDEHTGEIIRMVRGLRDGCMLGLSGQSNTGKSTIGLDVLRMPMRMFPQADLHIFDTENGIGPDYLSAILKLSHEEIAKRVHYYPAELTSTESIMKTIMNIVKHKLENIKQYLYDTKEKGRDGKNIKKLIPTFILNDSFSNLKPEDFKSIEKFDMTLHMRKNNINGMMLSNVKDWMLKANVVFISIVHEGQSVDTSSYGGPKREWQSASAGTHFGGGKGWKYHNDIIIRANKYVKADSIKLNDEMKTTNLDYAVSWDLVKSRFGPANTRATFCLTKTYKEGFCPVNSLIFSLKNTHKAIVSKGAGKYILNGWAGEPFFMRDAYGLFLNDPTFRARVKEILNEEWDFLLNGKKTIAESDAITSAMMDIF